MSCRSKKILSMLNKSSSEATTHNVFDKRCTRELPTITVHQNIMLRPSAMTDIDKIDTSEPSRVIQGDILEMIDFKAEVTKQMEAHSGNNSSTVSSEAPSLPEEIRNQIDLDFIENSDDSCADPDFEYQGSSSDSESDGLIKNKKAKEIETTSENNCNKEENQRERNLENKKNRSRLNRNNERQIKGETRLVRKDRKNKRNTGQEYVSSKGKRVSARAMRPLKSCRSKCKERISDEVRRDLFNQYWAIGDYSRRVAYITSLLEIKNKVASRPRIADPDKRRVREYTVSYHFQVDGVNVSTCKSCFIATFDESVRFMRVSTMKKLARKSGIVDTDGRGKQAPSNKRSEKDLENVRQHILSIPTYESHYTRRDSNKKYLPAHVTLADLYQEYKLKFSENPVSRFIYEREFHQMGISIKRPNKDTCQICDQLAIKINLGGDNATLKEDLARHHQEADMAYLAKNSDKAISVMDMTKKTITFDLQQCLPTPLVQSSLAFYKRQLWTFNLTIHDCDEGQAFCYMWHEGVARRGGDDIASCLYKYLINDLDKSVTHITMYSDTCGGQNKNSNMAAMCMTVLQDSATLKTIDHKFLVPGHTHMESDTDHSLIEKKKKKYGCPIEHPHDWVQLVRQVGRKKPFVVREMNRQDFYAFSGLFKGPLVNRKLSVDGNNNNWRHVKWLRYTKGTGILQFKTSIDNSEDFQCISFRRRGRSLTLNPKINYDGPVPIASLKKSNLLDLLPYISETLWDFYKNLVTDDDIPDVYPDASNSDDEQV